MLELHKLVSVISPEINSFNPKNRNGSIDNVNLSKDLSPLTKFILNVYNNLMDNNIIINFPEPYLKLIPLLSYLYADKFHKSVLVVTLEGGLTYNKVSNKSINKNYQLLNNEYNSFLFYSVPICYIQDFGLETIPYLPRANRKFKKSFNNVALIKSSCPKIILESEKKLFKIEDKLKSIFENNNKLENFEMDLGLIILENADRFFNSKTKCLNFIKWVKTELKPDILLLLHFTNPNYKFIQLFQEELNFIILPFNQSILKNNTPLIKNSLEYFDNLGETRTSIVNKYNLDNKHNYSSNNKIKISSPLIKSGGIDDYFYLIRYTLNNLEKDSIFNQHYFYKSINLLYSLYDLCVNPSFIKIKIAIDEKWFYFSIPDFIDIFQENLRFENKNNKFFLKNYLILLNDMYLELSRCKRYKEESSYTRIGKDYTLLKLIKELTLENELIIGTYLNTEPKILDNLIETKLPECEGKVTPIFMGNLKRESDDKKINKILILPGLVPEVFVSEVYKPYKEIIFLAFEGFNHKLITKQLDILTGSLIDQEAASMDYLKEIFNILEIDSDNDFFQDFNSRYEKQQKIIQEENKEIDISEETNISEEINNDFDKFKLSFSDFMSNWNKSKNNIHLITPNNSNKIKYDTITLNLENIKTNEIVEKELPVNKTFLSFKDIESLNEATETKPEELIPGEYVVIIDNNEMKTLIDLLMEIFEIDTTQDTNYIMYWKETFLSYIKTKNLKYRQLYKQYKNLGGTRSYQTMLKWGKGEVIGPQKEEDLLLIGNLMQDNIIETNYRVMFNKINSIRSLHRVMGRNLKKVIRMVLNDENLNNLSSQEQMIYENIQNGIYQILEN